MSETKILTLCGSLRKGSVNAAVMRAAHAHPPAGVQLQEIDISGIPFYDGDVEAAGVPAAVTALHAAVAASDGLIIFTPEYNSSFPAVTKNVIDWLSRPPKSWEARGMTLVIATPGGRAGAGIRSHFDAVMTHLEVDDFPAHGIGSYGDKLGEDGEIDDGATINALTDFVAAFATHCIGGDEKS